MHLNSTIFSGALWDLRQDVGPELADRIAYKALTEYLTPLDGFTEGRAAVLAAARDLGAKAGQMRAVTRSFNAHGIVPGWENALGLDSDTLLAKVHTQGVGVQAGGDWWTTSLSNDDGTEAYSVYAGRVDGRGAPKLMSPNDGRYHVYPATDGRTVVWAAYGPDGVDLLSRPITGGPVKRLHTVQGDVVALRVEAGTTVFDIVDYTTFQRRVGYLRPGDRTPTYVDGGRDDIVTGLPSLAHGRIAYAVLYPSEDGAQGYRLGVRVLDLGSGRTVQTEQLGEVQAVGGTALNSRHVFWITDDNPTTTAGRASGGPTPGTAPRRSTSAASTSPGALAATDITVSDTAVTVGAVPVDAGADGAFTNAGLTKIWQLSTDGARKQRLSCNRGEQVSRPPSPAPGWCGWTAPRAGRAS